MSASPPVSGRRERGIPGGSSGFAATDSLAGRLRRAGLDGTGGIRQDSRGSQGSRAEAQRSARDRTAAGTPGSVPRRNAGANPWAPSLGQSPKAAAASAKAIRCGAPPARFSTTQALEIQAEVRQGFADGAFQDALRRLHNHYPHWKSRGHPHSVSYFEAFVALVLMVYEQVLPKWGLPGNEDGLRDFTNRMETAMMHRAVKESQAEINILLGLPRDSTLHALQKKEEMISERPNGDGDVPGYLHPLLMDSDGDSAHEFWIESLASGELIRDFTCLHCY